MKKGNRHIVHHHENPHKQNISRTFSVKFRVIDNFNWMRFFNIFLPKYRLDGVFLSDWNVRHGCWLNVYIFHKHKKTTLSSSSFNQWNLFTYFFHFYRTAFFNEWLNSNKLLKIQKFSESTIKYVFNMSINLHLNAIHLSDLKYIDWSEIPLAFHFFISSFLLYIREKSSVFSHSKTFSILIWTKKKLDQ